MPYIYSSLHCTSMYCGHIPADPVRYLTSLPWRDGKRGPHGNQPNGFCATGVGAVPQDGAEKARGRAGSPTRATRQLTKGKGSSAIATFLGIHDMTAQEQIIDKVLQSLELAAAFQVANAVPAIRARLLQKLKDQLCERKEAEWHLEWDMECRDPYFGFRYSKEDRYYFALQFVQPNWGGLIWGITKDCKEDADLPPVRAALNSIASGHHDEWWVWYITPSSSDEICNIVSEWGENEKPWLEILDGTLADKIVKAAKRVNKSLSDVGLLGNLQ